MLSCVQERSAAKPQYPDVHRWQRPFRPPRQFRRCLHRHGGASRAGLFMQLCRGWSTAAAWDDRRSLTGPTPPLARPAWTVQPEGAIVTPQGLTRCCATMSAPGGKVRGAGLDEDRGQRAGLSGRQASGSRHEARNQRDAGHPFLGKLLAGSRRHAAGGRLEAGPPIVAAAVAVAQSVTDGPGARDGCRRNRNVHSS